MNNPERDLDPLADLDHNNPAGVRSLGLSINEVAADDRDQLSALLTMMDEANFCQGSPESAR